MPVETQDRMRTITIKGGTPQHGDALCRTCYWAHIQKGFRESEELLHCCFSQFRRVPFPVAECTDYNDKTVPNRQEMERIALSIDPSRARKPAGFTTAGFVGDREDETVHEDRLSAADVEVDEENDVLAPAASEIAD